MNQKFATLMVMDEQQRAPQQSSDDVEEIHYESHANAPVQDGSVRVTSEDYRSQVHIAPDDSSDSVLTWEASEYIHHQKDMLWFVGLIGATFVLSVTMYFLADAFSSIVVIVIGSAIAALAVRRPNVKRYSVSSRMVSIGSKTYPLNQFKSFDMTQEGAVYCITLMPLKQFMPPLSIYASQQDGDHAFDLLSSVIPYEQRQLDFIDRLMKNIRF